jgi:hypothetical protein
MQLDSRLLVELALSVLAQNVSACFPASIQGATKVRKSAVMTADAYSAHGFSIHLTPNKSLAHLTPNKSLAHFVTTFLCMLVRASWPCCMDGWRRWYTLHDVRCNHRRSTSIDGGQGSRSRPRSQCWGWLQSGSRVLPHVVLRGDGVALGRGQDGLGESGRLRGAGRSDTGGTAACTDGGLCVCLCAGNCSILR